MERPFYYVETNLLCGRDFRNLEQLNEVTAWWLAQRADVRVHSETGQRPVDRHAEELPYLLPLPAQPYDLAQVVYRHVSARLAGLAGAAVFGALAPDRPVAGRADHGR